MSHQQTTTWTTPQGVCPLTTAGLLFKSPTPPAWARCPTPPTPHQTPGESLHSTLVHGSFFSLPRQLLISNVVTHHHNNLLFPPYVLLSQYPSLWSVAGTTLTPSGSTSSSIPGGLTSQFLRGSSYTGLTSSLPVSSPSSMYDPSLSEVGVGEAQFESSIARLTASWAPVAQSYWAAGDCGWRPKENNDSEKKDFERLEGLGVRLLLEKAVRSKRPLCSYCSPVVKC